MTREKRIVKQTNRRGIDIEIDIGINLSTDFSFQRLFAVGGGDVGYGGGRFGGGDELVTEVTESRPESTKSLGSRRGTRFQRRKNDDGDPGKCERNIGANLEQISRRNDRMEPEINDRADEEQFGTTRIGRTIKQRFDERRGTMTQINDSEQ